MDERVTLRSHLDRSASHSPLGAAIGEVIEAIATSAIELSALIADGPLAGITGRNGGINTDGDLQKDIDVAADEIMRRALRGAPVAAVLSEEAALPETFKPGAPLCVAIDPLDGSANLANNISVGTIFSIRPRGNDVLSTFFEPGTAQCAAGFIVYGPQTTLVLALNQSVDIFILDRRAHHFVLFAQGVRIAPDAAEFAINASNRRHWHGPVRAYIEECLAGSNGNGGTDFNMRWIGSLVAESLRILVRGGVSRLSGGAASSALRSASDGAGDGMGGRRGLDGAAAHSGTRRENAAPAGAADHGFAARRARRRRHSRRYRTDVRQ
jgi:fructose-1,6-bisphosphatase I